MTPNRLRVAASLLALIALAAAATGCGRRGGLEPPPYPSAVPGAQEARPAGKPFILDPLIE